MLAYLLMKLQGSIKLEARDFTAIFMFMASEKCIIDVCMLLINCLGAS